MKYKPDIFDLYTLENSSLILIIGYGDEKYHIINQLTSMLNYMYSSKGKCITYNHNASKYCNNILLDPTHDNTNKIKNMLFNSLQEKEHTHIVLDNVLDNTNWQTDSNFINLFNVRSYKNTSAILLFNKYPRMKPEFRKNIDYIFLSKGKNLAYLRKIWMYYTNMNSSFDNFLNIYAYLDKYDYMVIDNTENKSHLSVFNSEGRIYLNYYQQTSSDEQDNDYKISIEI